MAVSGFKRSAFFSTKKKKGFHKVLAFFGKMLIHFKKNLITAKYTQGFKFYYGSESEL